MAEIRFKAITQEQRQGFEDESDSLLLWGPGGSGKSEIAVNKAIIVGANIPKYKIYLIRKKKADLRTTLWQRFKERLPAEIVTDQNETMMFRRIRGGTEFWGLGLDSEKDVNKLASAECGMAIIEEATEIPWSYYDEKIRRAVRMPGVSFLQTLLLCNPGPPSHWINQNLILKTSKGHKSLFMPTIPESAGILPSSWYEWLHGLKGVFAKRYRDGEWVAVEGIVYPYDPQRHRITRSQFKMSGEGQVVLSVDFGYDHPFVAQWWYISPDDIWYRYREIYMSSRRVAVHADQMKQFFEKDKIWPVAICDHDAENMADLRAAGIQTIPAKKSRLAGQQSVQKLFDEGRIFFVEDSLVELDMRQQMKKLPTKTEDEFPLYCWANKDKEDMIKAHDDGMDTMRYAVHTTIGEKVSDLIHVSSPKELAMIGAKLTKEQEREQWEEKEKRWWGDND